MTEKMIIDAYCRIRTIDNTIPDDVLDFIKDAAIEKLRKYDVVGESEQLSCGRNITTCVFYKDSGKCSNPEYCRDQTT